MTDSRQYLKRIWRVPKDRGPAEFLATVIVKALVKHAWPAKWELVPDNWGQGFQILHVHRGTDFPDDFRQAVSIACRIAARVQRCDIDEANGLVMFLRDYHVTPRGLLRETKGVK